MSGPRGPIYRLDLTSHERAVLLTVFAEHVQRPDAVVESVDAVTGERVYFAELLARVLNLEPSAEAKVEARARELSQRHDDPRPLFATMTVDELTRYRAALTLDRELAATAASRAFCQQRIDWITDTLRGRGES